MRKVKKLFILWLSVFVWSVLIFIGSSIPSPQPTQTFLDFVLHKVFHLFEYAVLFILVHRASHKLSLSILYVILYAFSDEIHQSFVPTRESSLRDVLIDFIGGLTGWWSTLQIRRRKQKN